MSFGLSISYQCSSFASPSCSPCSSPTSARADEHVQNMQGPTSGLHRSCPLFQDPSNLGWKYGPKILYLSKGWSSFCPLVKLKTCQFGIYNGLRWYTHPCVYAFWEKKEEPYVHKPSQTQAKRVDCSFSVCRAYCNHNEMLQPAGCGGQSSSLAGVNGRGASHRVFV